MSSSSHYPTINVSLPKEYENEVKEILSKVKKSGKMKSRFICEAIIEKYNREYNQDSNEYKLKILLDQMIQQMNIPMMQMPFQQPLENISVQKDQTSEQKPKDETKEKEDKEKPLIENDLNNHPPSNKSEELLAKKSKNW